LTAVSTIVGLRATLSTIEWIDAQILDELDYPRNVRGVAAITGPRALRYETTA